MDNVVAVAIAGSPVISADCRSVELPPSDLVLATLRERSLLVALGGVAVVVEIPPLLARGDIALIVFTLLTVCAVSEDIVDVQDKE